jgi:NAD(P)-dependent dehydrogenase (short-subunit alcohol dehydrogenase family)
MRTIQQLFDLKGKTALVTGGSRGLGLQIAEALGEQGARLVLSSRKQADLDEAVAHLKSRGIEASAVAADLAQESAVAPLVAEAMKRLGHIDILINNAGATWGSPAESHPLEAWDKVMNLNVRSIFLLSQEVARQSMIPRKYGRIVNVASIAGLAGNGPDSMQTSPTTHPRARS